MLSKSWMVAGCSAVRVPLHLSNLRPDAEFRPYDGTMARRAVDHANDSLVGDDAGENVTPEAFKAWLDQLQVGEPLQLGVTAAETLAEARAAGEV